MRTDRGVTMVAAASMLLWTLLALTLSGIDSRAQQSPPASPKTQLSPEGPTFRFSILGHTTVRHLQYSVVEKPYFGAGGIVEQRSQGRVKFALTTGVEANIRDVDLARTLRSGIFDFSRVGMLSLGQDLPLAFGVDLGGLYGDLTTAQRAVDAFVKRIAPIMEERYGMKPLGHTAFTGDVFFCRVPIKNAEDLKKKRVRTNGSAVVEVIDALGAINVTIPFAEAYGALQQGVVDCAVTSSSEGNTQKWWEIATHLYTLPVALAPGTYSVNTKVWNSIPADVQAFLQAIFAEVTEKQWELARKIAQVGIDCNRGQAAGCPADLGVVASRPMTWTEPTAEDVAKVKQALVTTLLPKWVARCGTGQLTEDDCRRIFNESVGPVVGITLRK